MNSPPASPLIDIGTSNVSMSSKSFRATRTESLDPNGYAKRHLLALSTTTNNYLFPAQESFFMSCRSISSRFHGQGSGSGIIATR